MLSRTFLRRRSARWAIFWLVVIGFCAVGGLIVDRLGEVPRTQADAESHLDRSILAYDIWDGTPVIVVELGGTVHFDRLILDWISIEWPPAPRWQWTGAWAYIDTSLDPASLGHGHGAWGAALFGQVNDPAITQVRCSLEAAEIIESVSAPGFAIQFPRGARIPDSCDFLNASGAVIWTANVNESEV